MIPFNKPYVPETSKKYAMEALESDHQQGDGQFTARASKIVSNLVGGGHVLLTPSCTHALEMASMLGNFGPGDEVILPAYTFTSAATAITKFGATPVFVDIDPVTKGIDANQVAEAVTEKTVAISWVNYAGVAPDIDALQTISKAHNLLLIEDNAHGLGGSYKDKPLGSFGDFATQSFHATKNIQCGEGGALVINNKNFTERAEIVREKGTNRKRFIKGEIQKYEWVDNGSSYLLAECLAAILLGQLEIFALIQEQRSKIIEEYIKKIEQYPDKRTSIAKIYSRDAAHLISLEFESKTLANEIYRNFQNADIDVRRHYTNLSTSPFAERMTQKNKTANRITQNFAENSFRLPLWTGLNPREILQAMENLFENLP